MSWWSEVPGEVWGIIGTAATALGTQIGLLIRWRREDKLRAEAREAEYQAKIQLILGDMIKREKEYTVGLLEHAQSTTELRMILNRVSDLLEDVAQALKDFLRRGP